MRQQLAAALRQQSPESREMSQDMNALRAITKRRNLQNLTSTIRTTKDVSAVLEDPKLPGRNELARWYPELSLIHI